MRQINSVLTVAIATVLFSPWMTSESPDNLLNVVSAPASADVTIGRDRSTAANVYYFTLTLPEQSETSFSQLSFTELNRDEGTEPIWFDFSETEAFTGTPNAINESVNVDAWIDETGTFWIEVDPSVAPGTTLTVVFKAKKPPTGTSYEYGVAAYPQTTNPVAVFVGNGVLTVERSQFRMTE